MNEFLVVFGAISGSALLVAGIASLVTTDVTYRAKCGKCGAIKREGSDDKFLDAFFIGNYCDSCNAYNGRGDYDIEAGRYIPTGFLRPRRFVTMQELRKQKEETN